MLGAGGERGVGLEVRRGSGVLRDMARKIYIKRTAREDLYVITSKDSTSVAVPANERVSDTREFKEA